ncbi:hypothetical protein PENTCL1PPCAC_19316, partial [Pristionchus entomophagus]
FRMIPDRPTPHGDEITLDESVPLVQPTAAAAGTPGGVLHRLWAAAIAPFRGCMGDVRTDDDEMSDAREAALRRLDSKSAADHASNSSGISSFRSRHQSEHSESSVSHDSGHIEHEDEDTRRRFLNEILEARGRLRRLPEKTLGQVLDDIVARK